MTQVQRKLSFNFLSAYKGTHDYCVNLSDSSKRRLSVRLFRDRHESDCQLSADDFERQVNGAIGYITTGQSELLTVELVAAFNRYRFDEHMRAEATILAKPKLYGAYNSEPYQMVVGGRFDLNTREWAPLHSFEVVRIQAGIPAEQCIDAVAHARPSLALAA